MRKKIKKRNDIMKVKYGKQISIIKIVKILIIFICYAIIYYVSSFFSLTNIVTYLENSCMSLATKVIYSDSNLRYDFYCESSWIITSGIAINFFNKLLNAHMKLKENKWRIEDCDM